MAPSEPSGTQRASIQLEQRGKRPAAAGLNTFGPSREPRGSAGAPPPSGLSFWSRGRGIGRAQRSRASRATTVTARACESRSDGSGTLKRWPWMLAPFVSLPFDPALLHTTTKSPLISAATEALTWRFVV